MRKGFAVGMIVLVMIHAVPREGMSIFWRERNAAESGCLACSAIIVLPFVYLRQAIFPPDITIDINGTKVPVHRESIRRFPDGTVKYVEPVRNCTIRVGSSHITFDRKMGLSFRPDRSFISGALADYADILVGERNITFGCRNSNCQYCRGLNRMDSRFIMFHRNGTVHHGTLAGKTVFTVEGRTYTLSHMDSVAFDPAGRPVKGWCGWTGDSRERVYFQTKDYREYPSY